MKAVELVSLELVRLTFQMKAARQNLVTDNMNMCVELVLLELVRLTLRMKAARQNLQRKFPAPPAQPEYLLPDYLLQHQLQEVGNHLQQKLHQLQHKQHQLQQIGNHLQQKPCLLH